MQPTSLTHDASTDASMPAGEFRLDPCQVRFFETFGFVKLPGLFVDEIDQISAGFDAVFEAHQALEYTHEVHFGKPRMTIGPGFVDRDERLRILRDDPRVLGIVRSLMGEQYDYFESDGNRYHCDTSWHCDTYTSPLHRFHIKLMWYLDPLRAESGALRVIPGTNHFTSGYACSMRETLEPWERIEPVLGVAPDAVPSFAIETDPGDLIVVSFRTMHATFNGRSGRRLFTINFGEPPEAS